MLSASEHPILEYLNVFFFSFRMPLFFIVSGIFLGISLSKKGIRQFIEDRARFIFYPFLLWGLIQITLQLVLAQYANADREPIDYLYLLIAPREIEQFWYLNALFFVSILYASLKIRYKFNQWHQLALGLVLYSISGVCLVENINIGFLSDVFFFYFFFAIGDCIAALITDPVKRGNLISTSALWFLLPLFLIAQYIFTTININHADDYYVNHQLPPLYALVALIGCAFIINLCYALQKLDVAKWLRVIGYHSLYIYVMHLIIIGGVRFVYKNVLGMSNVYLFLVIAISFGVLIPTIAYNLANKIGAGWMFELKRKVPIKPIPDENLQIQKQQIVKPDTEIVPHDQSKWN
jgi:fucose 4-O-acetylase-like acetyltransferase